MSEFQILHISDLHINSQENFDRSVVLDPLLLRVKKDLRPDLKPEIVVVTGDIAYSGIKQEYELAKNFFDDLLKTLKLSNDALFIVPGNHDVHRKKYRPSETPSFKDMKALDDELENEEYRKDLFKGMDDYFNFIEKHYPHLKSEHKRFIPFVHSYTATCGEKIGLVGLNSAWMCRKSDDKGKIAIGRYQVKMAMDELKRQKEVSKHELDIVINIFHHPLSWLWPDDMEICRNYFNIEEWHGQTCMPAPILLFGHSHAAEGGYLNDYHGQIYQFQAGGAYIGSESSEPYFNRFQYITFDWENNKIMLDFRRFNRRTGEWCKEGEIGDGTKEFLMIDTGKKLPQTRLLRNQSLNPNYH